MGCGKSTVGKKLSSRLHVPLYDLDDWIQRECQETIEDIFRKYGESEFRKIESQTLLKISHFQPGVISLGGGAVLSQSNRDILKSGDWFFLNLPFSILYQRIKDSNRPLVQSNDAKSMEQMLRKRLPYYNLAKYVLYLGQESPEYICQKILNHFK